MVPAVLAITALSATYSKAVHAVLTPGSVDLGAVGAVSTIARPAVDTSNCKKNWALRRSTGPRAPLYRTPHVGISRVSETRKVRESRPFISVQLHITRFRPLTCSTTTRHKAQQRHMEKNEFRGRVSWYVVSLHTPRDSSNNR